MALKSNYINYQTDLILNKFELIFFFYNFFEGFANFEKFRLVKLAKYIKALIVTSHKLPLKSHSII